MVTLVINPGSSSKKYAFYKDGERVLMIRFEKTKEGFGRSIRVNGKQKHTEEVSEHTYKEALQEVLGITRTEKAITSIADIEIVAIRIVAPGTFFQKHHKIDEDYIKNLVQIENVLPLHIPPILEEITSASKLLSTTELVGISDSAFHSTIDSTQSKYSLHKAEELDIRRYGYHGLSVSSISRALPSMFDGENKRTIVVHVGSGVSVSAIRDGISKYNSMGYTPASGVMMGSRAGDIDPGALITILDKTNTKLSDAHRYIQTDGGFSGLVGGITDLRVVLEREKKGDSSAIEAMKMFLFDIQSEIAISAVVLGGINTLVLTATAMERNPDLRRRIINGLQLFGVEIDESINESLINHSGIISTENSKIKVVVMPTDEMGEMERLVREMEL